MFKGNIKNYVITFIAGALFATATSVFAEDGLTKIEAYLRPSLPITLNGAKIVLENPPIMYDGSTYVKLRDIEKVDPNLKVNWNDSTQTVELKSLDTSSAPATVAPSPSPSSPPVAVEVDNQIYYSFIEFYQKYHMVNTVKNNKPVLIYKENKYEADINKNYFYDLETDYIYYSEVFLLQILTKDELNSFKKYHIDRKNKVVTNIA